MLCGRQLLLCWGTSALLRLVRPSDGALINVLKIDVMFGSYPGRMSSAGAAAAAVPCCMLIKNLFVISIRWKAVFSVDTRHTDTGWGREGKQREQFNNPAQSGLVGCVLYQLPQRLHLKRGAESAHRFGFYVSFFFVIRFFLSTFLILPLCKITCSKPQSFNLAFAFYALSFVPFWHLPCEGCAQQRSTHTHT